MVEDFGATFARQPSLLQAQLAHLHVIHASHEKDWRFVSVQFHLTGDVLSIEVRVPPATISRVVGVGVGAHEWDSEIAMHRCVRVRLRLLSTDGGLSS